MDRRLTPANARAALMTLRGKVDAATFTHGTPASITAPLVDLCASPAGPRDRQLLLGEAVTVIDRHDGWAFLQAAKDGYCGYVPEAALGPAESATHWVARPASHLYPEPRVQAPAFAALTLGARVRVTADHGKFLETPQGFIPTPHLRGIGNWFTDPVTVAESLLGTPYLWGGNSRAGIDCSGLTQISFLACGRTCPGDSDLQQTLGAPIAEDTPLQRGDLLFWKGHVAQVVDATRLIHANGHTMSTNYEDIAACIARILSQGAGPVTARRRP